MSYRGDASYVHAPRADDDRVRLREQFDDLLAARRLAARRRRRARERARAFPPFTDAEVRLLAFHPVHEWTGPNLTLDWWLASGAPVADLWSAAVHTERADGAMAAAQWGQMYQAPKRPKPWPVDCFGCWPRRPGG